MQKNVKGFIALFAALAAIILTVVGCMPMTKVADFPMWSGVNQVLGYIALALCLIAIVFAILSFRDKDKKGPRKTGMILGILCLLVVWVPMVLGWAGGLVTGYVNGDNNVIAQEMDKYEKGDKDSFISQMLDSTKDDKSKNEIIKLLDNLKAERDKNAK